MDPESQRRLANLQGVIKWSLAQVSDNYSSKDPGSSEHKPMDEETKKWLKEALAAMSDAPSDTDLLRASLAVMRAHHRPMGDGGERGLSDREAETFSKAVEDALYFIEDLDHANDLIPLGGVEVVGRLLGHVDGPCRRAGCELMGTAAQNNLKTQSAFLPYLPDLFRVAGNEVEEGETRVKAFFAISCMIRENEVTTSRFFEMDGVELIFKCIASNVDKLQVKSLFLLRGITDHLLQLKEAPMCASVGKAVSDVIVNSKSSQVLEMALSTLAGLTKASQSMTKLCRQDGRLKDALKEHVKELEPGSDELKYCLQLLHTLC